MFFFWSYRPSQCLPPTQRDFAQPTCYGVAIRTPPSHLLSRESLPGWAMVIQLCLNPTGAAQSQVWSNVGNPHRVSDLRSPGQCPTPGASDAARGQVPKTGQHGSVEGPPRSAGPGVRPLHHVSWGLKGLGQGPRGPGPRTVSGTGQPVDNGQGRMSLHPLNLTPHLESSGWDGLKPRGPFIVFSTNIFYNFEQMNYFPFLGFIFLICKMGIFN